MNSGQARGRGFTLVELAIVLLIVAVLLGGLLMPLSAQIDMRNAVETERNLAEVREALIGYAASHYAADGKPYLPCPDTNDDGTEDRPAPGACPNREGRIPWIDLGVGRNDAWNNRFRYRVAQDFDNNSNGFDLSDTANLVVCADSGSCASTKVADKLPAVIVSHGKNGFGAFSMSGGTNPAPTGADELGNVDGADNNFVSRTPGPDFDDIVVWLSPNILYSRMISAGRLP